MHGPQGSGPVAALTGFKVLGMVEMRRLGEAGGDKQELQECAEKSRPNGAGRVAQ